MPPSVRRGQKCKGCHCERDLKGRKSTAGGLLPGLTNCHPEVCPSCGKQLVPWTAFEIWHLSVQAEVICTWAHTLTHAHSRSLTHAQSHSRGSLVHNARLVIHSHVLSHSHTLIRSHLFTHIPSHPHSHLHSRLHIFTLIPTQLRTHGHIVIHTHS